MTLLTIVAPTTTVVHHPQIRRTILDALDAAADKDPIDRERINSVLHQFELSFKHKTSNFGLNLMYVGACVRACVRGWVA